MLTYNKVALLNMCAIVSVAHTGEDRGFEPVEEIAVAYGGQGVSLRPFAMATGKPVGVLFDKVILADGVSYQLSGSVYPVDNTVYLVRGADLSLSAIPGADISQIPHFAQVTPDATGTWCVDKVSGISGDVYCLASTPVSFDALQVANITIKAMALTSEPDDEVSDGGNTGTGDSGDNEDDDDTGDDSTEDDSTEDQSFQYCVLGAAEYDGGEGDHPEITVSGRCTTESDCVYISIGYESECSSCLGTGGDVIQHTCGACSGNGTISAGTCEYCGGSGWLNESDFEYIECPECNGISGLDCCIGCEDGYLPPMCECPVCSCTGEVVEDITCPVCWGSGGWERSYACEACEGSGWDDLDERTCRTCNGTGVIYVDFDACDVCGGSAYTPDLSSLRNHIVDSVSCTDGTYSVTFDGDYDVFYIAWSYGDTGYVSGDLTWTDIECLSPDSLITMSDGTKREIVELVPGDFVLSRTGQPTRVTAMHRGRFFHFHTKYYFEDGTVIDESHRHRFFNVEQGFWQYLDQWRSGEHAMREDGAKVALTQKVRIDEHCEMCGLWTEDGSYYANGLLTGETAVNQHVLVDMPIEKAAQILSTISERGYALLLPGEGVLP